MTASAAQYHRLASAGQHIPVPVPPARVFADTLRTAVAQTSPAESLRIMIDLAAAAGPGDAVTIMLRQPGGLLATMACTDDRAAKADRLQYDLGGGPGVDAAHTGGLVLTQDLLTEDRWPGWSRHAAGIGVGAAISVQLFIGGDALGSLTLYSAAPRRYCTADLDTATLLGAYVSLLAAQVQTQANLRRAIDSRTLIGQAQGMLMQRYRISAAESFTVLRRYSSYLNIKIAVLAEELTSTGRLPDIPTKYGPEMTGPACSP